MWNKMWKKLSIFGTIFFLKLIAVLMPPKLLARFVLWVDREQFLKILSAAVFRTSKKKSFKFKNRGHTGRPVDFDKERLNHFYMKVHTKRSDNIWSIWSV